MEMTQQKATATGKAYYEGLLSKGDHDYAGMDQGPMGTKNRHMQAIEHLSHKMRDGAILDLGCGTGLFTDSLVEAKCLPNIYVGVDFLEERRSPSMARATSNGIVAAFYKSDIMGYLASRIANNREKYDVAVALGVVGPAPFSTYRELAGLIRSMKACAKAGLVTVPMQVPHRLGIPEQAHFDLLDAMSYLNMVSDLPNLNIEQYNSYEFSIWWAR